MNGGNERKGKGWNGKGDEGNSIVVSTIIESNTSLRYSSVVVELKPGTCTWYIFFSPPRLLYHSRSLRGVFGGRVVS
jgi:hypothetical protein